MKNNILYLLLACFSLFSSACSPEDSEFSDPKVTSVIDSLRSIYAPDSRIARIDIVPHYYENKLIIGGESSEAGFGTDLFPALEALGYEVTDSIIPLPHPSLGEKHWALINVSVANLRGAPSHSKELITQALMGTPVKVLRKSGNWYLIQTPDKYLAWTDAAALFLLDKKQLTEWNIQDKVIITKDYDIIREGIEADSHAVSDIVIGCIIKKSSSSGKSVKLILPDGRIGFLSESSSMDFKIWKSKTKAKPDQFIKLGLEMLGRPYLWGGTSSKGMDCSGFVKTLYFSGGVILPRDASQQVFVGDLINTQSNFSHLMKGDLLFFGKKATDTSKERITHVGMYIGNDKYIHSSGRVKINSLNPDDDNYSQYLIDIFVKAKRIIDNKTQSYPITVEAHSWYNTL